MRKLGRRNCTKTCSLLNFRSCLVRETRQRHFELKWAQRQRVQWQMYQFQRLQTSLERWISMRVILLDTLRKMKIIIGKFSDSAVHIA